MLPDATPEPEAITMLPALLVSDAPELMLIFPAIPLLLDTATEIDPVSD